MAPTDRSLPDLKEDLLSFYDLYSLSLSSRDNCITSSPANIHLLYGELYEQTSE